MTLEEKRLEFEFMENSKKGLIRMQIPNGPELSVLRGWDYKGNLSMMSCKTLNKPKITHDLLEVKEINLAPVTMKIVYLVTVLRYGKSNLKNDNKFKNSKREWHN